MNDIYLLTGGNLGNRADNLAAALLLIEQYCGRIVQRSSVYETAAWGMINQPDFYNQVLHVKTGLTAQQLMHKVLEIEEHMGRTREIKMGPRIIDIDILFYNNDVVNMPGLIIPHPRLQDRRFALLPLTEIAADYIHPVFRKTVVQLLDECTDTLNVHKIETNN